MSDPATIDVMMQQLERCAVRQQPATVRFRHGDAPVMGTGVVTGIPTLRSLRGGRTLWIQCKVGLVGVVFERLVSVEVPAE